MIEKGRTDQIIEQLIDSVENGQNVPFAPGKVSVNKEETIRLLRELENIVQGELFVQNFVFFRIMLGFENRIQTACNQDPRQQQYY